MNLVRPIRAAAIPALGARRVQRAMEMAFASWPDRLLLALMLTVGAAALCQRPDPTVPAARATMEWLGVSLALGITTGWSARIGIDRLGTTSIVAAAAHWRPAVLAASLVWLTGAATVLGLVAHLLSVPAVPLAAALTLGYTVGWCAAPILRRFAKGPLRGAHVSMPTKLATDTTQPLLSRMLPAAILLRGGRTRTMVATIGCAAALAGAAAIAASGLPYAALVPAVLLGLGTTTVSPSTCRFTSYLGLPPMRVIAAHLVPLAHGATASLVVAVMLTLARMSPPLIIGDMAAGAAIVAASVAYRVFHYRQKDRTRARVSMRIEMCVLAVTAAMAPPLAIGISLVGLGRLVRSDRAALRVVPA